MCLFLTYRKGELMVEINSCLQVTQCCGTRVGGCAHATLPNEALCSCSEELTPPSHSRVELVGPTIWLACPPASCSAVASPGALVRKGLSKRAG